jgi:beta-glucosidase/6-phospho-beta-glucosidase/beta-galactosidase
MEDYENACLLIKQHYKDLSKSLNDELFIYNLERYQEHLFTNMKKGNFLILLEKSNRYYSILVNLAILSLNILTIKTPKTSEMIMDENRDLFKEKNSDYGNSFEDFGLIGILVRLNDKINRLKSISKNGINVKNEKLEDTINDLYNYCVIGLSMK